jgi:HAD superfamily hydrolase (TIGR01509 family)
MYPPWRDGEGKRAWLFDLDGTLLRLDVAEFVPRYLQALGAAMSGVTDPARFVQYVLAATAAMTGRRGRESSNQEVFWREMARLAGDDPLRDWHPIIADFYRRDFPGLGRCYRPDPAARRVVQAVLDAGAEVILATNPLFPAGAVVERMRWAGIDDLPFALVTSYEHMHACKPHLEYYLEILERRGLEAAACVMVGNDVQEDVVPARQLGMTTFLVTGLTIDRSGEGHLADGSGELGYLATLVEGARDRAGSGAGLRWPG